MALRRKLLKHETLVENGKALNEIIISLAAVTCCVIVSFMIASICPYYSVKRK